MSLNQNKNLIEEIARKQAEIANDIAALIEGGGAHLTDVELLAAKQHALADNIETLRQKQAELQPEVETLAKTEGKADA